MLVVVHDMFHSFFEDISMYEDILKGLTDTKIVVFNYPGIDSQNGLIDLLLRL